MRYTISILITCYNEGETIYNAIKSIRGQSDQDFEVILVNDASPDEKTNTVCRELSKKYNVYFHNENKGLSAARNTGFEKANGEIIVPLDADDILPPNAIKHIRKGFLNNPEAGFAFGNYLIHTIEDQNIDLVDMKAFCDQQNFLDPKKIVNGYKLLGTSPCKKETWLKVGGYHHELGNTLQDIDFWYRVMEMEIKGIFIPHEIYQWNKSNSGMNNKVQNSEYLFLKLTHLDFITTYSVNPYLKKKEIIEHVYNYTKELEKENEKHRKIIESYKNSTSFKLGNLLLKPFNIFKK